MVLPNFINDNEKWIKGDGSCLKQGKISFTHGNIINYFIVYKLDIRSRDLHADFTWSLYWVLKLTKNADPDKYYYSGHGTGFNSWPLF